MSLASRLALATFGYRGGYSGSGVSETRYVVQEVQVIEMKDILNSNISIETLTSNVSIETIMSNVSIQEIGVSVE